MKIAHQNIPRRISALALPTVLLAPTLRPAEPSPWDTMSGTYTGTITVTASSGKQLKGTGSVLFTPSAATFAGVSFPRQDVKEVVIRRPRNFCCESVGLFLLPMALLVEGIQNHDIPMKTLPIIVIGSPVIVGMAAVTGPPVLIIEGIRRLKPAKVLYKVVP
jgi:hypothetical protein